MSRAERLRRQKAARARRNLLLVMCGLAVIAALVFAFGLGDGDEKSDTESPAEVEIERVQFGQGAEAARVIAPVGIEGEAPIVVFMHGWGELDSEKYRAWMEHLARRGNVVIVPRYQTSTASPPEGVLSAALAGVRSALAAYPAQADSLVVVGHSAGGALAADYAAAAASDESLPDPVAVFAVYPGRAILGTGGIPAVAPTAIPPSTRILALGSPTDTVVGETPARELVETASAVPRDKRRFVRVTDPAVADHYAPLRDSDAVKAEFWRPLDALIDTAR